jgi:lipoprotein-anchoring transpeptidase ErfK/SrfK
MFKSVKDGYRHNLEKMHIQYGIDPTIQHRHRAILLAIIIGVLLVFMSAMSAYAISYGERAAPGSFLAGIDVSGMSKNELRSTAEKEFDKIKLTLTSGEIIVHTTLPELGINLDADATVQKVLDTGNERNIFAKFNPFVKKESDLVTQSDKKIVQENLNGFFYDISTSVQEPIVAYKGSLQLFEVVTGSSGEIISVDSVMAIVEDLLHNPRELIRSVDLTEASPVVSDANAGEARDYANQRLKLRLNMIHNGKVLYYIDPWDMASFFEFTTNEETGKFDISYSDDKIKTFLDQKLTPSVSGSPVTEKVLVNQDNEVLMVITAGKNGMAPSDVDGLVDQIKQALINNETLSADMALVETAYRTEKIVTEDDKWIEYNVSTFTLTLWDGSNALWSTNNTSNGKASTPTIVGSFRVYLKNSIQTMTGGVAGVEVGDDAYYSIPGVKWVTYWGAGGYAFHTASWLGGGNVRSQISHGCVNLFEDDAKKVYDFAEIGTRVVVHY